MAAATKYIFEVPLISKQCEIDWLTLKILPMNSFVKKQIIDESGTYEICFTKLKDSMKAPTITIDILNPYKKFDYIILYKGCSINESLNRPRIFPFIEKSKLALFINKILHIDVALFVYEKLNPAIKQKTRNHVRSKYGYNSSSMESVVPFPYSMIVCSEETENSSDGLSLIQQNHESNTPTATTTLLHEPPPAYSDLN